MVSLLNLFIGVSKACAQANPCMDGRQEGTDEAGIATRSVPSSSMGTLDSRQRHHKSRGPKLKRSILAVVVGCFRQMAAPVFTRWWPKWRIAGA